MFDIYKLNSENETAENKASKLLKNGLAKLSSNSNLVENDTLNFLRYGLEKTFQKKEYGSNEIISEYTRCSTC